MSTTAAGHDTVPLEFPVRGQRIAAILRTPRVQPTARATGAPGAPDASGVPGIVLTGPFTGVKEQVVSNYARRLADGGMATLVFDHPTPMEIARLLLTEIGDVAAEPPIHQELQKLEDMLGAVTDDERWLVVGRLRRLLAVVADDEETGTAERIEAATTMDEVLQMIDAEFGEA